jgi:hypothetical protein
MTKAARVIPARAFAAPASLREVELCSVSYLKPTEYCPIYREHFKADDEIPSGTCRVHREPSLRERVTDTVKGWLDRLKGIFR